MKRYFYVEIDTDDAVTIHRCLNSQDADNMVTGNALAIRSAANKPNVRSAKRIADKSGWPVELKK